MDVRRSRGEFDRIKKNFVINPALIGSQSIINMRGSQRTQDLAQKLLNCFTIQSRVMFTRGRTSFYKEIPREKLGLFHPVRVDSWPWSRDGRGPWSYDDHGPRSQDLADLISIITSRWVHLSPHDAPQSRLNQGCQMSLKSHFKHVLNWCNRGPRFIRLTCTLW